MRQCWGRHALSKAHVGTLRPLQKPGVELAQQPLPKAAGAGLHHLYRAQIHMGTFRLPTWPVAFQAGGVEGSQ